MAQKVKNLTSIHEVLDSIPGLSQRVRIQPFVSYGVGHRHGWDPALLWLWCRPAATAPIQPLAWELPYATGAAQKRKKGRKKERKEGKRKESFKKIFFFGCAHIMWQFLGMGSNPHHRSDKHLDP